MKIVHVNTYDISGGAARAMFRLHSGMLRQGHAASLVALHGTLDREDVVDARASSGAIETQELTNALLDANRTTAPGSIFSGSLPGIDISCLPRVRAADVVNLHWIARFQSPASLLPLFALGKPVLWRLPDQWAMTGGCHYSGGCAGYLENCDDCPQLAPPLRPLAAATLAKKKALFARARVSVVSPSRWLAECAAKSAVFANQDVRVIPNGIDTRVFYPQPRAKRALGLPADCAAVLFVATHAEKRKGLDLLARALQRCLRGFPQGLTPDGRRLVFLRLGLGEEPIAGLDIPVYPFGYVDDDERLRLIYSAADVFVIPSTQENFPSTALEAMSCGLPVVGFDTGGIADIVRHGENGLLVPSGDEGALAVTLGSLLTDRQTAAGMGEKSRARILAHFSLEAQVSSYLALYESLLAKGPPSALPDLAGELAPGPVENGIVRAALEHDRLARSQKRPDSLAQSMRLKDAGKFRDAEITVLAHLDHCPGEAEAWRCLGAIYAVSGRTGEALDCFERALALAPDKLDLLLNMSDACRYAGRHGQAHAALDRIEQSRLALRGLGLKRGQAYAAQNRPREAIRALAREYRLHGCGTALELMRENLRAIGKAGECAP